MNSVTQPYKMLLLNALKVKYMFLLVNLWPERDFV